jgi:hypothetical protein
MYPLNQRLRDDRPKGDRDPGWHRISWDEALDEDQVAQRYAHYDTDGGEGTADLCRDSIAVGKPATQSSTAWGGVAERAVDGDTNGSWSGGSVTHTAEDGSPEPWWQVDLGETVDIDEIAIWNRTDCCGSRLSDYYVLVADEPFESEVLAETLEQPGVTAFFEASTAGTPTTIQASGLAGRFIRVQLTGTAPLSLAEVEIFGSPID